jgi:hypothetical protein
MIRTKDVAVAKIPGHILALEALVPHDVAATELLALVLNKLQDRKEEISEVVLSRESCVDVAVMLPQLEALAQDLIKASVSEFNDNQPEARRSPADLSALDFDVHSLLARCEIFQAHSPLLRDQLKDVMRTLLPMSLQACPDCALPLTAEELELERQLKEQEEAAKKAAEALAQAQAKKQGGKKQPAGGGKLSAARKMQQQSLKK